MELGSVKQTLLPLKGTDLGGAESSLRVTMCRFNQDRRLEKAIMSVRDTKYFCISHVWGVAQWRTIPGVDGKILASEGKAKFIVEQLTSLVLDSYFWMDVLCIDQKDGDARVAVTQHIPTIFRAAVQTFLVRDGGGFRTCCAKLVKHNSRAADLPIKLLEEHARQQHPRDC